MGVTPARRVVNSTRVLGLHVPDVDDRVIAPRLWDRRGLLRQSIPDPYASDERANPASSVSSSWYTAPAWCRHDGHGRGTIRMELLLYIAMGVFALLFAVVLYHLIAWAIGQVSRSSRAGTPTDRQPGDAPSRPDDTTTGRRT